MPGGLGTLDELFEAATLIQCQKIGPFPIILMDRTYWKGLQLWGQHMMKHGVFDKKELGFGRITDSPREAVELIVRSMPTELRRLLKPQAPR
jgi:predicted Rossmann-fold nucleotide-binding protein